MSEWFETLGEVQAQLVQAEFGEPGTAQFVSDDALLRALKQAHIVFVQAQRENQQREHLADSQKSVSCMRDEPCTYLSLIHI